MSSSEVPDAQSASPRPSPADVFDHWRVGLGFPLDDFQERACAAVGRGEGVLVAAPTGAGKTVVGEYAVALALATGRKAFYTTPIKALSNQKYADLVAAHGEDQVGLLTGDVSRNGEAPVVVMTTEVLRNMLYAGSHTIADLGFVVMDEVHYLADRFRGAVWEEVLLLLPESVQVISLSATVSNAEEFGAWLTDIRGATQIVVSERRPVPLWQHILVGTTLHDLFRDGGGLLDAGHHPRTGVNPELQRAIEQVTRSPHGRGRPDREGRGERGAQGWQGDSGRVASRADVVRALDRAALLPAITFIFSRAACEAAVSQLLASGVRLLPPGDAPGIRELVEERTAALTAGDKAVLGYDEWVEALTRGFAAHHAGLLPLFREVVEELFVRGVLRAVYATETLALGINMPARSVVLEKLVKFNGLAHTEVTPAEYTQLTGRAGRRGIDVEGHAIVQWRPGLDPAVVGGLAGTRTYPLRSSFAPTANMAVNVVARLGRERARSLLEASFAQFQADRSVVDLVTALRREEARRDELAAGMVCEQGDFREYARLRRELADLEKNAARERGAGRRAEAAASIERLRVGDVVSVRAGRRPVWAVVVRPAAGGDGRPGGGPGGSPILVTADKRAHRLQPHEVRDPLTPVTRIEVPRRFNLKNAKSRADLATALRIALPHGQAPYAATAPAAVEPPRAAAGEQDARRLREALRAHPCHDCPDREEHARWGQRWSRATREIDALRAKVSRRTNSLARTFERVCDVLSDLGYLTPDGLQVTSTGAMLQRLYTDKDLVAAECLRTGVWQDLPSAQLAGALSALVYESRREDAGDHGARLPAPLARSLERMERTHGRVQARLEAHALTGPTPPDPALAGAVARWAGGAGLGQALQDVDIAAGDFVRLCRQVADLLGQVADATPDAALRSAARTAVSLVRRGVVGGG